MSWLGSAITTGASMLGGLIGNNAQKKNINRQIRAQQEENQKNREYNLMLAQQQKPVMQNTSALHLSGCSIWQGQYLLSSTQ